jgi:hypothetical protein
MHIAGMSALAIADRMTPNGVRHSIAISETIVHSEKDETIPSAPTTPRRKRSPSVGAESMRFCGSAAGMATLGMEVDRSTVTWDMVATGAPYKKLHFL